MQRKRDAKAEFKQQKSFKNLRLTKNNKKADCPQKRKLTNLLKIDKTNRTRKSQCQKDALWNLYKTYKGHTPPRDVITNLSQELNLSEQQVYKWFWDTKKKVDEDTMLAKEMGKGAINDFGGYSKAWKTEKEIIGVDGRDGNGAQMTP